MKGDDFLLNNIDAYKQIYYLEQLCREYTLKYTSIDDVTPSLLSKLQNEAIRNKQDGNDYEKILNYSHLGEIYDFLKSKRIREKKNNTLDLINVNDLISHRNDIMHSRSINFDQAKNINRLCSEFVENLKDDDISRKWNKFITIEIKDFKIPLAYVLYPFGKSYKTLIGRDEEMHNVKECLKTPMPISIIGHGGLGKTALVLQLVEDYLYSPSRPFENIFFFSFKDNNFSQGQFVKIDKIIQNYDDVIKKLADFLKVKDTNKEENFEDILWTKFFETNSLLILDNLETEIVHSNLNEFVQLANKFIINFNKNCRLLITSRSGMGNNEQKITLNPFSLEETKKLVMINSNIQGGDISKFDWEWIQNYSKGNPGLINALCYSISSTNKTIKDLRIEYDSKYTEESLKLHEQQETFINFCFENTLESLPTLSKEYLAAICYVCSTTSTYEISEGFLSYLKEYIFSKKIHQDLDTTKFTNIGFLQSIPYSKKYRVNEFFVVFLDGNLTDNDETITTFDIQKSQYNLKCKDFIEKINQIQFNKALDIEEIMAEIYKNKYRETKNLEFAIKAFFSYPTLKGLDTIFSNSEALKILENRNFIDKVPDFKNPSKQKIIQEKIIHTFIDACFEINSLILNKKTTSIKQDDLVNYYLELEKKITILKTYNISIPLKAKICRLLNNCSKYEMYEKGIEIAENEQELSGVLLISYTKLISQNRNNSIETAKLIAKGEKIVKSNARFCNKKSIYSYKICALQYYVEKNEFTKIEEILIDISKYEPTETTIATFSLQLELELTKLEFYLKKRKYYVTQKQFENINNLMKSSNFKKLYFKNQQRFKDKLSRLKTKNQRKYPKPLN